MLINHQEDYLLLLNSILHPPLPILTVVKRFQRLEIKKFTVQEREEVD